MTWLPILSLLAVLTSPLSPGDHTGTLRVDGRDRTYRVHVPPQYRPETPTPLVLVLHGAAMDAGMIEKMTRMSRKADEAGFIAVYPNGTGVGFLQTWEAGLLKPPHQGPDDVKFIRSLLDELAGVLNVDPKRVYATGLSNGGMMSYRLAAELSDRIAAIAPVGGTMAIEAAHPPRPVPVLHFHGTKDTLVLTNGPDRSTPSFVTYKSVAETLRIWRGINGCPETPVVTDLEDKVEDGIRVRRHVYGPGRDGSEVVFIEILGGGHTWPGKPLPFNGIGPVTLDISANDLIWEFFRKHPLP